eukprot:349683-Chlamydomonas_euryale.AAC.1
MRTQRTFCLSSTALASRSCACASRSSASASRVFPNSRDTGSITPGSRSRGVAACTNRVAISSACSSTFSTRLKRWRPSLAGAGSSITSLAACSIASI